MTTLTCTQPYTNQIPQFCAKDPVSALTHFIGFLAAIVATPGLLIHAAEVSAKESTLPALGIFMLSMILLYGASASYHAFNLGPQGNRILKKLDHFSIFLLIAGSYTPVTLTALSGPMRPLLLGIVWSIALLGMIFKFLWVTCPKWISSVLYIAMGWTCLLAMPQFFQGLGPLGFGLILAGGLLYTAGGVIYALKIRLFSFETAGFGNHEIFHLFVMAGSICHYLAMYLVVCRIG